jgi:hypothetical protein
MRVRVAVAVTYRMHEQLSSINVGGSVVTTNPAACNIKFSRQAGLCSETANSQTHGVSHWQSGYITIKCTGYQQTGFRVHT